MPKLSVLMAVHNDQHFIKESIESVLSQTFKDFEFIIIDDCSTDGTFDILTEYSSKDRRIRLLRNEKNLRLPASLNRGLELCEGEYVARMDGDDICHSERFAKQVSYLDTHQDVGVLGSWAREIDEDGVFTRMRKTPIKHSRILYLEAIRPAAAVIHPSVMFRRSIMHAGEFAYNESFTCSQDKELWCRLLPKVRFWNLPEALIDYRVRSGGISQSRRALQRELGVKAAWELVEQLVPGKWNELELSRIFNQPTGRVSNENIDLWYFQSLIACNIKLVLSFKDRIAFSLSSGRIALAYLRLGGARFIGSKKGRAILFNFLCG